MKKIITLIAIALATLSFISCDEEDREPITNPDTDLTISETLGIYTLTGKSGVLILGNEKDARNFFNQVTKVFTVNAINSLLDIESDKYELKSDDQGKYLIKVGAGGVKLRYSDAIFFTAYLDGKLVVDKGKKVWKVLIE